MPQENLDKRWMHDDKRRPSLRGINEINAFSNKIRDNQNDSGTTERCNKQISR